MIPTLQLGQFGRSIAAAVAAAADWFLDNFTGAGTLNTHAPGVGGAYTSSDDLTTCTLNGSGFLNFTNDGGNRVYARSLAAPGTTSYFVEAAFTITTLPSNPGTPDGMWLDIALVDNGTDAYLINWTTAWDGVDHVLTLFVFLLDGTTLFGQTTPITSLVTVGDHVARFEVTPAGVAFLLDGVVLGSTSALPDSVPDAVEFSAFGKGATVAKLDYINGTDDGTLVATEAAEFLDNFNGALGLLTSHTADTGQAWAYSANIIFGGYSPHSGDAKVNGSGVVGIDTAGGYAGFVSDFAPASPDYYVEARVKGTFAHSQRCGIAGRYVEASGAGYFLETFPVDATHVAVTLQFWDGGANSGTLIARGGDHVVVDPTDYRVRLAMTGTTIECFVDGVSIGSVTNAFVTGAGTIGGWLAPSGSGTYNQIAFEQMKAGSL